jgi:glucose-1-phosphate thymidylyltransferase
MDRVAIILSGGTGSRLWPSTLGISKQLLPVYDKPMIFYPLSTLILAGIREFVLITNSENVDIYKKVLGDGSHLGITINVIPQIEPKGIAQSFLLAEDFIRNRETILMLGDNLFFGDNFPQYIKNIGKHDQASVFGYHVENPSAYGVVEIDDEGQAIDIEEKPASPKSDLVVPGLYFYPKNVVEHTKTLIPSSRGELEITDLNKIYIERGELLVNIIGRGVAWLDMGTPKDLREAGEFIAALQNRQGFLIGSIEEASYRAGFISNLQFRSLIVNMPDGSYKNSLLRCLND